MTSQCHNPNDPQLLEVLLTDPSHVVYLKPSVYLVAVFTLR